MLDLTHGRVLAGAYGQSGSSGVNTPRQQQQGFAALRERMEIISPADIKLVKFLGAGGYGEVSTENCDRSPMCREANAVLHDLVITGTSAVDVPIALARHCSVLAHVTSSWSLILQVYLGKWHGSEVAVKCLNPGLFFGGGEANNHAAVTELVKEADMLGR